MKQKSFFVVKSHFDPHKLFSKMDYHQPFMNEMTNSFSNYVQLMIPEIEKTIALKDAQKLKKLSHSFECILAYVYASRGVDFACALKTAAVNGDFTGAERIYEALKNEVEIIEATFEETLNHL